MVTFQTIFEKISMDPQWINEVIEFTAGKGINVAIDPVAGVNFNQVLEVAAVRGRIVNVGRLGGATGAFDFELHAQKRIAYTGVTFRTRTVKEVREVTKRMLDDLSLALAANHLPCQAGIKAAHNQPRVDFALQG